MSRRTRVEVDYSLSAPPRDRISAWNKSNSPAYNPLENPESFRGYSYDAEGQLTAASYEALTPAGTPTGAQRTESFVYDALGNRKGSNVVAGRGAVTFYRRDNGLNQYSSWTPSAIYYDDNYPGWGWPGNGVMMAEGSITASYNALNQPIAIWSPAYNGTSNLMWFGFDPLGRCVKRWDGPSSTTTTATYLYYDGWNLIQEGTGAAAAERMYLHGNRVDGIVCHYNYAAAQWRYHHYDARGHCILLTNPSGALIEQYEYDAFGKPYFYNGSGTPLPNGSAVGNRFLFTGREYLSELKLYDYRNRLYQPELARFLQPDPKHFAAGDYNLYRYCHNDPVNKVDPTGEFDIYIGVEADLVPIFGGEVGGGIVIDFSNPMDSGIFGNAGFAGGGNAGIGVGGGFALRNVEGKSLNGDVNLGKVSVTASMDEEGFNGMGASVGPGLGASASLQETKTLTLRDVGNWIKEQFTKKPDPRALPDKN